MNQRINDILDFWYADFDQGGDAIEQRFELWFRKNKQTDEQIKTLFSNDINKAINGDYDLWVKHPLGRLAVIILIDQFCRHVYRGEPRAFEYDSIALNYCLDGIELGADQQLPFHFRYFFYLPLEHAENLNHQQLCVEKFETMVQLSSEEFKQVYTDQVNYANQHLVIIERFGRFPHRNKILGRASTAEEIEFLKQPGSSF